MNFKNLTLSALLLVLAQACGTKNVTLTLNPGVASVPITNLMQEITAIKSTPTIDYRTNFCNQPNVLAGAFYESSSSQSELISVIRPGILTNFYDAGTGTSFSSLVTAMRDPSHTKFTQVIELNVPTGREIGVGMMGVFKFGDPNLGTNCVYPNPPSTFTYRYASFSGSVKLTPSANMTVNLPILVAPDKGTLPLLAGNNLDIASPLPLTSPNARREFLMVWVKVPVVGSCSVHTIDDLTLRLEPGSSSSGGAEMEMELVKNYGFGSVAITIPSSAPSATAGAYTGYLVPQADRYEFTINYRCISPTPSSLSKTVTCTRPMGRTYFAANANNDGINTFVVDITSASCVAP